MKDASPVMMAYFRAVLKADFLGSMVQYFKNLP
jgi:hypothetical protein